MAYLKRVLKPRRQIKFVYITNTYKALLRDKSNVYIWVTMSRFKVAVLLLLV